MSPLFLRASAVACLALAAASRLAALDLSLGQNGVVIPVAGMGEFTLSYPTLQPGERKPVRRAVDGKRVELTYADDTGITLELAGGGRVSMAVHGATAGLKSLTLGIVIGTQFGEGGTWRIGGGEAKPFPAEKPPKPFLFQGNAASFAFTDPAGHALSFSGMPDYAYQQLQDNREWKWNAFSWAATIPYNSGWKTHDLVISDARAEGAAIKPQVDRLGQTTRKDFPGKAASEDELKADVAGEGAYYAALQPMATDAWGGQPGSKDKLGLKASGFFRVQKVEQADQAGKKADRWLLVDPDGNACFHLGVCCFGYAPGDDATYVKDRREIYEWLPPVDGEFAAAWHPEPYWHGDVFSFYAANVIRKYGAARTKDQQLSAMIDRVRAMGFNAIGAFSGDAPCFGAKHFPRMAMVGVGPELPGIRGVPDPFDDATLKRMDESWAKGVAASADDPLIIGYFFANEQGFEDIPRGVPQLNGKHAAKRRLVELLRKTYPTIAEFAAAWGVKAADFDALADQPLPVTTKQAFADMQAYTELFLDAYYRAIATTFRKYDKNHLMVANRWQPGTANNEALCRAAGKYMDVISINYYTLGVDRAFMKRLHDWTGGKPQMWSEFYYTSGAESNAAAGGLDMATQKARGEAYRAYIEDAADLGFVVGIEWFTLIDQAVTGRWFQKLDGERANTGIFNVCDRPYRDLVAQMALANREVYEVMLGGRKPFVIDDPRFHADAGGSHRQVQAGRVAPGAITLDGSTAGWPGRPPERIGSERVVGGKDGQGLEAAFKLAWDDQRLYLLANVTDPSPLVNNHAGAQLWNGDGIELFIGGEALDRPGTLLFTDHQVLLGAKAGGGAAHVVNAAKQPDIQLVAVPTVDGEGYTLEAAIPWSALDIKPAENAELLFDLAIDDAPRGGDRARQLMWNGGAKNSADRSAWGRLRLVP